MELSPCPLLHQWFSSLYIKVWLMSWLQCRFLGPIPPEIQFCRSEAQSRNLHDDTPPPSLGDSGRVHRGTHSEKEDFKSSRACAEVCSPKRHTSTTSEFLPQGHAEPHVPAPISAAAFRTRPVLRGCWHHGPNWREYRSCYHRSNCLVSCQELCRLTHAGLIDGWAKVTWFAELAAGALSVVQTFQALPCDWAAGPCISHINVVVTGTWPAGCSGNSWISIETSRAFSTLHTWKKGRRKENEIRSLCARAHVCRACG